MAKSQVTSLREWRALPELVIPALARPTDTGTTCRVLKVGFYLARSSEVTEDEKGAPRLPGGRVLLPTIVVEHGSVSLLSRLPIALAAWAQDAVALAREYGNPFPADVEFFLYEGRYRADIR